MWRKLPSSIPNCFNCSCFCVGVLIFFIIFFVTGFEEDIFDLPFCLSNSCVGYFAKAFSSALAVLSVTGALVGGLVTFGGIVVALLSYVGATRASALSNHISHLSIFSNYVYGEIDKRDRLSRGSFDVLRWYNLIYNKSRLGELLISGDYILFMSKLNCLISGSNSLIERVESGGYRYKPHQESMKNLMLEIGVSLDYLPRTDFYEVEGQLFDLIKTVNMSFCQSERGLALLERKYI